MLNPVAMSIITNTFTDRERTGSGGRRVGSRGRHQHGARPTDRRSSGRVGGMAFDLLDQPARRRWPPSFSRSVSFLSRELPRPGAVDPVGQATGDPAPGLVHLWDHRGAEPRAGGPRSSSAAFALAVGSLIGLIIWEGRARRTPHRSPLLPIGARSRAQPSSPSPPLPRWAASSFSTPSISKRCGGSPPFAPGSTHFPWQP